MIFINLTPREINVLDKDNNIINYESNGFARIISRDKISNIDNFRLTIKTKPTMIMLPNPSENVIYIVSEDICKILKDTRKDLVFLGNMMFLEKGIPTYDGFKVYK